MTDITCLKCGSHTVLRSLEWWSNSPYRLECLDCKYVWTPKAEPQPEPAEAKEEAG